MVAFLYPGQGSQQAGIIARFVENCPETHPLLAAARGYLSSPVYESILNGRQEELKSTRLAQPALLVTEACITARLQTLDIRPRLCAGHSLGEISALIAAGALIFTDALLLITERARLMSENVPPGGMAAVMGLSAQSIAETLPDDVDIANFNGPNQTIISGSNEGLQTAAKQLKECGAKRVIPLAVSGPFHSRHMKPAGDALAKVLANTPITPPAVSFLSSVSANIESDPERIRQLLAEQLYSPVQWTAVMEHLSGEIAVEVGPGTVLQGLAKRIPNGPTVHSAATPEQCVALVETLEQS